MIQHIDKRLLRELAAHTRRLGVKRTFQSMGYERSGELPLVASRLEPLFGQKLRYLDLGSGDGVLPSFILRRSAWDVTCVDKFSWVQKQHGLARRAMPAGGYEGRFHVLESDFLATSLPESSFDVITNISVIEHFEGSEDSVAMEKSARLLRPGGLYILTTLMNEGHFKEFFVQNSVYGERYEAKPVFFQRHYDAASFEARIVKPSGLVEKERLYFGDYGFQFCERFMVVPWPWKPLKIFYQWAAPSFAARFMSYRDYPVSRPDMHMYTASGVFVVLQRA
jgi:SAM-dependent methyltransferase